MVFGSQDLWRRHPLISRGYKAAFPGLRLAVPAFAAFVVIEKIGGLIFSSPEVHSTVNYTKGAIGSTPEVKEH